MELLPFFEWLESSMLGQASKSYDFVYVVFQTFHLLALALIGGTVLATDLRLMNVIMRDVPAKVVSDGAHKWFKWGLAVVIFTGIFMLAGVAIKCYTKESFWIKMGALLTGILFIFFIKRPLLNRDLSLVKPVTLKLVAIASITTWFTVAAAGRWIGFS